MKGKILTDKKRCFNPEAIRGLMLYLSLIIMISMLAIIYIPAVLSARMQENTLQLFLEANKTYENGDYALAAQFYEGIINGGIHSGDLYYNLGNCYTKQGEIGKAIVNYRRAERLMPRDGDLRFNLNYVLDQTKDKIETKDKADIARVFFFWYHWLSMMELCYLFIIANIIFWIAALVLLYKQNDGLRWIRNTALIMLLIFGITFGIKAYSYKFIHHGIVISAEATVRSGNGDSHSPLFILHEGAEFRVREKTDGWMKISLPDGKTGWISNSSAQTV
ncbi:tetratricopeptide repeat protein [bacterium]|nr:tetratricopeptide repeat protein [bacterium]